MKAETKPTSKTRSQTNKPRAGGKQAPRIVVSLSSLDGTDLGRLLAGSLTQDLRGNRFEPDSMAGRNETAAAQDPYCCEANAPVHDSKLIPSLVKSLYQELAATREAVVSLTDRLTPVLAAPKKDAVGILGNAAGDGAPSLANELSAIGNGFYSERRVLEDVIARLQL